MLSTAEAVESDTVTLPVTQRADSWGSEYKTATQTSNANFWLWLATSGHLQHDSQWHVVLGKYNGFKHKSSSSAGAWH